MTVPAFCVFCHHRPVEPTWRPFCSERCKLQDLARWVDGTYSVPGETVAEPDESENVGVKSQK